ncbi:MAG: hypothetical protein WBY44_29075 [Bryobacteraceae bacterium]
MLDRSKKRPRDPNQLAYQIMLESTGQAEPFNPKQPKPVDPSKNPHAVALGRLGGLKGGMARAAALGPKKRSQIAAKAAKARWGKKA